MKPLTIQQIHNALYILYDEAEGCISNLIKARLAKDEEAESLAIYKMETFMTGCTQELAYIIERTKEK